ncbi:hypothetical protein U1Q18_025038, partial [Sarracenia purpurea var. burkii]
RDIGKQNVCLFYVSIFLIVTQSESRDRNRSGGGRGRRGAHRKYKVKSGNRTKTLKWERMSGQDP